MTVGTLSGQTNDADVARLRREVEEQMMSIGRSVASVTGVAEANAASIVNLDISFGTAIEVNVRATPYNATGNGVTDDTTAFINAAQAARGGSRRLLIPRGTYNVNREINVSGLHVQLEQGAIVDFGGAPSGNFPSTACMYATGTLADLPALNANVAAQDTQIVFASAHGLAVGDVFAIYDPTDFSFNLARAEYRAGEWCRVQEVTSATEVMIDRPLVASYVAATVTCHAQTSTTLQLTGGEIRGVGTSTSIAVVEVIYGQGVSISNVELSGTQWSHINLQQCVGVVAKGVFARDYGPQGSTNYGININSCRDVVVADGVLETRRHPITCTTVNGDAGVPGRNIIVANCVLTADRNAPMDVHGATEFYTVIGCDLNGGISLSGDHGKVVGCRMTNRNNNGNRGILLSEMAGTDLTVADCDVFQTAAITSGWGLIDWAGNTTATAIDSSRTGVMRFENVRCHLDGSGGDVVDLHYRDTTDVDLSVDFVGFVVNQPSGASESRVLIRSETDRYKSIRFQGCDFTTARIAITDDDLQVDYFEVSDCRFNNIDGDFAAVTLDGPGAAAKITGCDFSGCKFAISLGLNSSTDQADRRGNVVSDCTFHDFPTASLGDVRYAIQVYGANTTVSDCNFADLLGASNAASYYIRMRSLGFTITGCTFGPPTSGSPFRAIACDGDQAGVQARSGQGVIADNLIDCGGVGESAIHLENTDYSVTGNIIIDPGDYGVQTDSTFLGYSKIVANLFRETDQTAVGVNTSSGDFIDISGNTFVGFDDAIRVTSQSATTRDSLTIMGNIISGHSNAGIEVDASAATSVLDGMVIDSNRVDGGGRGIRVQINGAGASISRLKIGQANDVTGASINYDIQDGPVLVRGGRVGADLVAGDWTASSGWGDGSSVVVPSDSRDCRGRVTVNCAGSGIAANPTLTLAFADGSWPNAPRGVVVRNDTNSPTPAITWTTTTTTLVVTFNGTPTTATAYTFDYMVGD